MLPIHTILHPTDFSDRSCNALHLACALARDYDARLVLLHVVTTPPLMYGESFPPADPDIFRRAEWEEFERLEIPDTGIVSERRFEEGDPVQEILRVAGECNADLLVMGTHGRTGLTRLLMGSVAEQVVRRAPCPVLTVTTPFPLVRPAEEPAAAATAG
jgi:nucleotide-binding universal stress UspA family protein